MRSGIVRNLEAELLNAMMHELTPNRFHYRYIYALEARERMNPCSKEGHTRDRILTDDDPDHYELEGPGVRIEAARQRARDEKAMSTVDCDWMVVRQEDFYPTAGFLGAILPFSLGGRFITFLTDAALSFSGTAFTFFTRPLSLCFRKLAKLSIG